MTKFYENLVNAYECSTAKNNLFEKFVKENAKNIFEEKGNYFIQFDNEISIDCDSLNPFEMSYCEFLAWADDYTDIFQRNLCNKKR